MIAHPDLFRVATPPETLLRKRLARGVYRINEDDELEKRCSKCKEYWPADSEFFYCQKNEDDGIADRCKACCTEWRIQSGRDRGGKRIHQEVTP